MRRYIDPLENNGDPDQDASPDFCPRCGGRWFSCNCEDEDDDGEAFHVVEQMRLALEPYRDDREAA